MHKKVKNPEINVLDVYPPSHLDLKLTPNKNMYPNKFSSFDEERQHKVRTKYTKFALQNAQKYQSMLESIQQE